MRIDQLHLQNFRCFENKTLDFTPAFNVLIGDNGSGKTAVLESLAVALDPAIYKAPGTQGRPLRPDDVRRENNEPQFEPIVAVTAGGVYAGENLTWQRSLSDKPNAKTTSRETAALRKQAEDIFGALRKSKPVIAPVVSYFTTGRLWRQKYETLEKTVSPGSKLRGYDFSLDAKANDAFLFRWFKTKQLGAMQSALQTGSHFDQGIEAIRWAIGECMEGDRKYLTFDIEQNEVIVTKKNVYDPLPFRMLSDGQRGIAAMILDIGYRCVTLNPHLGINALEETPGIVLIDEIDLHLHPKWQRRIVNDLRRVFPKIQFVATTHSPLIIQSLRPGEVIDLNGGTPRDYYKQSVEEILTDEMGLNETRRNEEYEAMKRTAEQYFRLLEDNKGAGAKKSEELKEHLDKLTLPYHGNPAYVAYRSFLEQQRLVTVGNC